MNSIQFGFFCAIEFGLYLLKNSGNTDVQLHACMTLDRLFDVFCILHLN